MYSLRRSFHLFGALIAMLPVLSIAGAAPAAVITFTTPSGSVAGGQPVDANVTFTLSADQIVVTLNNLQSDPTSVIQNLSGLAFLISTGQTAGTIVSDSAVPVTVAGNGSFTDGGSVSAGWALSADGNQMTLDVLGSGVGPAHTVIGPPGGATYANANGSIAGNGPHNPFLDQSVMWTLSVPGVTSSSTVTSATFSFGTSEGSDVQGSPGVGSGIPEPATMALLAAGGMLWLSRRRGR